MLTRIDVDQHQDPVTELVKHVLKTHADNLPDLSAQTIILPNLEHSREVRKALLAHSKLPALIPPRMLTLRQWADEYIDTSRPVINNHARELMMVEVLKEHPDVFAENAHSWSLADELLVLFDELNLSTLNPDKLLARFDEDGSALSAYSAEAHKINILWQARDQHLHEEGVIDRNTLYRDALNKIRQEDFTSYAHPR